MFQWHDGRGEPARGDGASGTATGRRQFVRTLGAGGAAVAGLAGTVEGQGSPAVSMADNYFDPVGLAVEPGTTVRFEVETGSHSATAYEDRIPEGATPFDSGVISAGSFEHTFETPGTYDYYCTPHRSAGMVGRIVVGEPGGPAEGSPIPDGAVPDSETIAAAGSVGVDEFEGGGGRGDRGGHGMGAGGRMRSGGPGWMLLVPVGFLSALLGLVGGVVYWAGSRGRAPRPGARGGGGAGAPPGDGRSSEGRAAGQRGPERTAESRDERSDR